MRKDFKYLGRSVKEVSLMVAVTNNLFKFRYLGDIYTIFRG